MPSPRIVRLALLLTALFLPQAGAAAQAKSGCPEGETKIGGKCVKACPTAGSFTEPDACECPTGYGKIQHGSGTAECSRVLCPSNSPFPKSKDCDCDHNFAKVPAKGDQVICKLKTAPPAAKK